MQRNNFLSSKQGGFRKGFSTTSSMGDLTDNLFNNINQGLVTLAVFVDLKKAFDTVNHGILLKKLEHSGVRGINLDWCTSYLSRRLQRTFANAFLSREATVECGVPQGSVLGPAFFILYVNDMQNALRDAQIQLYANDTVIHAAGETALEAAGKLQPCLDGFVNWCEANKLSLNVSKTKLMAFGTRNKVKKAKTVNVYAQGKKLQMVPTYKYLGFSLDSTLSFKYHVNSVIKTVLYKVNLLSKVRKFMSESVALKVYKSMILPYFDYGDVIYDSSFKEGLDKLQRLQNKCLKICKGLNIRFETDILHTITKCPKLGERRKVHINVFMHKRTARAELLDLRDIRTRAHDATLFKVKIPKNEAYKRSIEYAGSNMWNSLPTETRNIKDYDVFKQRQKRLMLESVA